MPGQSGSIQALAQNPKIPAEARQQFLLDEETRLGLICGVDPKTNIGIPCPIWTKFERYFVAMVTFNFGTSFQTGNPVVKDIVQSGRLVNSFFSSRRRHTILKGDWSSDVCSSDLSRRASGPTCRYWLPRTSGRTVRSRPSPPTLAVGRFLQPRRNVESTRLDPLGARGGV